MMATADPWSDASLMSTAAEYAGVGLDADLEDVDRFRAAVSRLVAKRIAREKEADHEGVAIFLLEPQGPPLAIADQGTRVPMLDRAREPLECRLWFVTHVVTVGTWIPATFDSDDELFRYVTDEVNLGDRPAIIYDSREGEPHLRFYPSGLDSPESVDYLQIAYTQISINEVFRRIDLIHKNQLVTPGIQQPGMRVWKSARKGHVASRAEDIIGALLSAGLHTAFPTCRVRVEQPQPTGRLDIEIEERIPGLPGAIMRHAILELKVLRGRNESGRTEPPQRVRQWIADGVDQAAAYREDKGALAAALCCFDMRRTFTGDACFAHVLDLAADSEIDLRVWHLFDSAPAYRRYLRQSGKLTRRSDSSPEGALH